MDIRAGLIIVSTDQVLWDALDINNFYFILFYFSILLFFFLKSDKEVYDNEVI